jgi:hypothetical protein
MAVVNVIDGNHSAFQVKCPAPPSVRNGVINAQPVYFGDSTIVTCNEGVSALRQNSFALKFLFCLI